MSPPRYLGYPQSAASNEKHFEAGTVASTSHSCNPVAPGRILARHAYPPANWSSPEIPSASVLQTSPSRPLDIPCRADANNHRDTLYFCIRIDQNVQKSWKSSRRQIENMASNPELMGIGIAFEAATPARPKCLTSTPLLASTGSRSGTSNWHASPIPKSSQFISSLTTFSWPFPILLACGLSILSCCRLSHPSLLLPLSFSHSIHSFLFVPFTRYIHTALLPSLDPS